MPDKDVTVAGDQTSSVPGGTAGTGGVTQVTPAAVASDANGVTVESLQALLVKAEADRKAVQAIKDREVAEERRKREQLAQELENIKKQGMTEAEQVAYERDQYKAQLESLRQQSEAQKMMQEYGQAYASLGVDPSKLDYSSPEALATSGWQAVAELVNSLKSGATPQQKPVTQTVQSTPQNNSKVITGSGGVPRVKPTMRELMDAVGAKSPDDFYRWAEHHPDQMNQWLKED